MEDEVNHTEADIMELRKGPWTLEEDALLFNYVSVHGEGRWNSLASHAGLKRTGKSCRLRWLNYLRPSVRRGNITLQEQLLILELHSRWGNRWSKIAQYLPGRTDNEIKNYWRTRVQKQAKQLKCDVNSKQFQDAMRYVWIPRLMERIQATSASSQTQNQPPTTNLTSASASSSDTNSDLQSISDSHLNPPPTSSDPPDNGSGLWQSDSHYGLDMEVDGHAHCNSTWVGDESLDAFWNEDDLWVFQQHLCDYNTF